MFDRVIKLSERTTDLIERGVVALEKLAGTPSKDECEHDFCRPEAFCRLCGITTSELKLAGVEKKCEHDFCRPEASCRKCGISRIDHARNRGEEI
jgi:hypothetical protein